MKTMRALCGLILLTALLLELGICAATDTLTYTNKYILYGLASTATSVTNSNSASFPSSVDTLLYLGDPHNSNAYSPSINTDYGLTFDGESIALIRAS
jgi:hypothetical protein